MTPAARAVFGAKKYAVVSDFVSFVFFVEFVRNLPFIKVNLMAKKGSHKDCKEHKGHKPERSKEADSPSGSEQLRFVLEGEFQKGMTALQV